jgi:DNA-binding MarR family transcriptional regulator
MRDECRRTNTEPTICTLEVAGDFAGRVQDGLPWAHKGVKERIDHLEKAQRAFEKLPRPAQPTSELASDLIRQYSFLRATVERVVQDLVLNGTVQRYRDYIDVSRLEKVVGVTADEVAEIRRIYQRCHDLVEAHDPASAKDEAPPTPEDLKNDIASLKVVVESIRARRKDK